MTAAPDGFWLRLGRVILITYIMMILATSITGAVLYPAYAAKHTAEFFINPSWTPALTQAGLAQLGWPTTVLAYLKSARAVLVLAIFGGLALLLLWRRSASWFILYLAFTFANSGSGASGEIVKPLFATLPALQSYNSFMAAAWWQLFFILFYFFPDGRPVPAWTRWLVRAWLVLFILYPFFSDWMDKSPVVQIFLFVLIFCAIGSQIYRFFRCSDPLQRQQTKWVVAALILLLVVGFGTASWGSKAPAGPDLRGDLVLALLKPSLDILLFAMIPLGIFLAVIRYRLWDIEVIIRRTLVYSLLTALLALLYYGSVTVLQSVFTALGGSQSTAATVISTLAIAALFTQLRRRVQDFIDWRFFRRKYDAEQTLADFAAAARSETDLAQLTSRLTGAVQEAIQPEQVSLWLRPTAVRPKELL